MWTLVVPFLTIEEIRRLCLAQRVGLSEYLTSHVVANNYDLTVDEKRMIRDGGYITRELYSRVFESGMLKKHIDSLGGIDNGTKTQLKMYLDQPDHAELREVFYSHYSMFDENEWKTVYFRYYDELLSVMPYRSSYLDIVVNKKTRVIRIYDRKRGVLVGCSDGEGYFRMELRSLGYVMSMLNFPYIMSGNCGMLQRHDSKQIKRRRILA